jgi:glycosyltransferase involved in cell wall biosynthesis
MISNDIKDRVISNSKISVVMSVYNGEDYLSESIESILNQTYKNIEFVIINDGSTDSSLEIIKKYMELDDRIILINQENKGLTASLNIGISKTSGEYIARQDADDISMPDRFMKFYKFMKNNNFVDVYSTPAVLINGKGESLKTVPNYFRRNGFHKKMLNYFNCLVHGTLIIRSRVIKSYRYNEDFKYSQDFELYHNLLSNNYQICYDPINTSYRVRTHNNQISFTSKSKQSDLFRRTLESRSIKFFNQTLLNRLMFRVLDVIFYLKVAIKRFK